MTKSASKQSKADLAKKAEIKERKSQKILEDNEEWELKSCGGFTRIYPSLQKPGFPNGILYAAYIFTQYGLCTIVYDS